MVSSMIMYNECSYPPKHPLVFVSWSLRSTCTNSLTPPFYSWRTEQTVFDKGLICFFSVYIYIFICLAYMA